MERTPVKHSSETKLCVVCASIASRPNRVESTRLKYNLKDLLMKYGGINVECGLICRNCNNRLVGLHEKCIAFYSACQKSCRATVSKSKRLLPATPTGPSPRASKRLNLSDTPKNLSQTCARTPSKIPTPVARFRKSPGNIKATSKTRLNFETRQERQNPAEEGSFIDETGTLTAYTSTTELFNY